jgi:hypothetical protein
MTHISSFATKQLALCAAASAPSSSPLHRKARVPMFRRRGCLYVPGGHPVSSDVQSLLCYAIPDSTCWQPGAGEEVDANTNAAQESGTEDERPNAAAAVEPLAAAQRELAVLIDLIGSVACQQAVAVHYVDSGRPALEQFDEAAVEAARTRAQLRAGAARLRGAVRTLRQQVQQDNAFVRELSRLQVRAASLRGCGTRAHHLASPCQMHVSLQTATS